MLLSDGNSLIPNVSCCPCVLRLTSTAQPERELSEHGQRKGIQGAQLCRDDAHKHRSHDQHTGGTDTVSKYVTRVEVENKTCLSAVWSIDMKAQAKSNLVPLALTLSLFLFQISALGI